MRGFKEEKTIFSARIVAVFVSLFLVLCAASFQPVFANGSTPVLVETQWLEDNLNQSGMSIIYIGGMAADDKANFDAKHVPGSSYIGIGSLMGVLGNGSAPPDKAKFEALMSEHGISNDSYVVVYGSGGANPFIPSAYWILQYFGHDKVSYLNGGLSKWNKEGRKTAGEPTKITAATYKAGAANESIMAGPDDVLAGLKNSKVVIVDTRQADVYSGEKNEMPDQNKRAGHIPGAINLNYYPTNLNEDGTFKSADDLKAAYEAKGVTKDKEVITYCQGGVRGAHTYLVLKHILGYPNVKVYVGSWGEWSNLDPEKYPVEK